MKIVGRQFDCNCSDVLFQARKFCSARDGNDPRLLREQPSESDLSKCRLLPFCDRAQKIDQGLVSFQSLRRKARHDVAEVGLIELRLLVDLSREEPFTKRTEWNESDSEFFERPQQFLLRPSPPQRVFALDGSDRLDCVRAADRLHSWFRKTEVLDLAFPDQLFYRSRHIFDRHIRVNTVLIV